MCLTSWVLEIFPQFLESQRILSFTLMRIFEAVTNNKDISNGDPHVSLEDGIKFEPEFVDESLEWQKVKI